MNVQLPDNSVVQFPDGMPEDQINAAITQHLGGTDPITMGGRFAQGMTDPSTGIAQLALHGAQQLPDSLLPDGVRGADKVLDQSVTADENQYQARRAAAGNTGIDWARLGGGMAASAPIAAVLPQTEGGLLAQAGMGIAQGAGYGAIQPVSGGDYGAQKEGQMLSGGITGGIMSPVLGAVAKAINPEIQPEVNALMRQGITPTPGQILGGGYKGFEDKLSSIPYLGDVIKTGQKRALDQFNSAALGRALSPIGETTDKIGRAGINEVSDKLSAAYDTVLPKLNMQLDEPFAAAVEDAKAGLPKAQQKAFDDIMGRQFEKFGQNGMTGEPLKGFQSEISQAAKGYGADASYDQRQLGSALDEVHSALGDALMRWNPTEAQNLQNINEGYANYATLRRAQSGIKEDGPFTPAQLAQAIRGNDKSVGKGSFAKGNALMQDLSDPGVSVLGNTYPESGTAGRGLAALTAAALVGGHFNPGMAVAGAGASMPYLNPAAQKLAAALLTKRPDFAPSLSRGVSGLSPFLLPGAVAGVTE